LTGVEARWSGFLRNLAAAQGYRPEAKRCLHQHKAAAQAKVCPEGAAGL